MLTSKINNEILFYLACRCNVSEVCAVAYHCRTGRFPKNFYELYHTDGVKVLTNRSVDASGFTTYMVYKDPYIRTVDNYNLLVTGRQCPILKNRMRMCHGFVETDSFADFMEKVVKTELSAEHPEGHIEPMSWIPKKHHVDFVVLSEDLPEFFKEQGLPYNAYDYNECDPIDHDDYLQYKDEIYELYKDDLLILDEVPIWKKKTTD